MKIWTYFENVSKFWNSNIFSINGNNIWKCEQNFENAKKFWNSNIFKINRNKISKHEQNLKIWTFLKMRTNFETRTFFVLIEQVSYMWTNFWKSEHFLFFIIYWITWSKYNFSKHYLKFCTKFEMPNKLWNSEFI